MTTILQAAETIFEYVRGHTGLQCSDLTYHCYATQSGERQFRVDSPSERLVGQHPGALFMDTLRVEVNGLITPEWEVTEPPPRWWVDERVVEQNNGVSFVLCRFIYDMPQKGVGVALRTFMFRNGMIRQVV